MLEVVQLGKREFIIRNTITGLPCNNNGKVYRFRSERRAIWKMNKIAREFNRAVRNLRN